MAPNHYTRKRRNFEIIQTIYRSSNKNEFAAWIFDCFHNTKRSHIFLLTLDFRPRIFRLERFLVESKKFDCLYGRSEDTSNDYKVCMHRTKPQIWQAFRARNSLFQLSVHNIRIIFLVILLHIWEKYIDPNFIYLLTISAAMCQPG